MKTHRCPIVAIAGLVALILALGSGAASLSASEKNGKSRPLHVTKDCLTSTGLAGAFCVITSSNLPAIKVGSKIFYDQAAGVPAGMLDSNVILDTGGGDRAVGRCTLDFATGLGLCTFSDGTGRLAGFRARVDVSSLGGRQWAWDGTYRFRSEHER
jgi:hypothetical protein